MSDVYAYWRAALKDGQHELSELMLPTIGASIPGENPQPGLYSVRLNKGAAPVLMHIWLVDAETLKSVTQWRDGLALAGQIGKRSVDVREISDRWIFAAPVTREAAAHWREHGQWPGDAPALPPRTHNQPTDPYAMLLGEAHERIEQAKARLTEPIADQTACDMARNLQAELLAVVKRADGMHEVEKRPHLEAGRAVDRRYDFRVTLSEWAGKLRDAFGSWMAAEERRLQEQRDREYREQLAAAEAERARIEAHTGPGAELPPLPEAPEPVKVRSGGGTGRKAGLKNDWDVEITDYRLAALQVIDDPDVAIQVGKALKRRVKAAKGRIEIPGCKIIQRRTPA